MMRRADSAPCADNALRRCVYSLLCALAVASTCSSGDTANRECQLLASAAAAYNALDAERAAAVVDSEEIMRKWRRSFAKFRARGQKPNMTIETVKTRKEGALTVVEAKMSLAIDGEYETRDEPCLIYIKQTAEGPKITKMRWPRTEAWNRQFDMAPEVHARLRAASLAKNWRGMAKLFAVEGELAAKLSEGDEAAYRGLGLGWLYEVAVDPERSLRAMTASFEGRSMALRCQVVDQGNATVAIQQLFLTTREDPETKETLFLLRPPSVAERRAAVGRKVRNFWAAVRHASAIGYVQYTRAWGQPRSEPELLKILPDREPTKTLSRGHEVRWRFRQTGQYVVPLWDVGDTYEPVGGIYNYPVVPEEHVAEFYGKIKEWLDIPDEDRHTVDRSAARMLEAQGGVLRPVKLDGPRSAPQPQPQPPAYSEPQKAFLLKTFETPVLKPVLEDSVTWLAERNYFARQLSAEELAFWQGLVKRPDMDSRAKREILDALAKQNLEQSREALVAGLTDRNLANSAARSLAMKDPEGLRKLLLGWLDDPQKRTEALRLGLRFRNDPEFLAKVNQHFPTLQAQEVRHYLPYLMSKENRAGFPLLEDYIVKNDDIQAQALIFSELSRYGDPRPARAVFASVEKLWKRPDPHTRVVVFQGLAYLCAVRDPKGLKMAKGLLPQLDKDPQLRGMFQMYMSLAARKPLMDWTVCKGWVMSLK